MKVLDEDASRPTVFSGSPASGGLGSADLGDFMKLRTLGAAFAAAGLLASASQAAADGFILTFQGTVSQGSDATNIFGLGGGASLVGQGITETFVVDYAGGGNHDISGAPYFRDNIGGAGFITSAVTINGVTTSVGSESGIDDRTDEHLNPSCSGNPNCKSGFSESTEDESFVNTPGFLESWTTFGGDFGQSLDYHPSLALGPPVFTAADNLDLFGSFTISHELFDQTQGVAVFDYETHAMFTADTVTITTFGGVPEPAAWALMLAGFGATGAALRRRRSAMAAA